MDKNPANDEMIPTILLTKKDQRSEILKKLEDLDWATVSAQINQHLQDYFQNHTPLVIAGFSQHKHEPDVLPFLHFWHQQGGDCCLSVVVTPKQALIFRKWDLKKPLVKGVYNILIPPETETEIIPDVILTPLLAFDQNGARLGKGAGYYDRTLKALRKTGKPPLVIGVAAYQQFTESLQIELHDELLDMVVTDKGVIRFK